MLEAERDRVSQETSAAEDEGDLTGYPGAPQASSAALGGAGGRGRGTLPAARGGRAGARSSAR